MTFSVTNPGSTNLTITQLQYYATAQVPADMNKAAKIFNGNTQVWNGTLAVDSNSLADITDTVVAPGQTVQFRVVLDAPFGNTAGTPVAGNRVFQISNVEYSQTFGDGTSSVAALVGNSYTNTVKLPVAAKNY